MKYIIVILLFLIGFNSYGQLPSGFPTQMNTGWQQWGYQQSTLGTIIATRDTNWLPRFPGTTVYWIQASDTSSWQWTGQRWKQVGSGGGSSGLVNYASNGLSLDLDTVQLGGTLNQNTVINLNGNNLDLSGSSHIGNLRVGNLSGATSVAKIQSNTGSEFIDTPYLALGPFLSNSTYATIHTSDTVTTGNVNTFMGRGFQLNRNIVMSDNNLTISDRAASSINLLFRLRDTVRLNPVGSDLLYANRNALIMAKAGGFSGRSRVQSGLFDFDVSTANLSIMSLSGGSGSNNFRLRGFYSGNTSYLFASNATDTIDNWIGYWSTGFINAKVLKAYHYAGGSIGNADTTYNLYFYDVNTLNYLNGNTGLGTPYPDARLHVNGRSHFTDTGRLDARFSYSSNINGSFTQYSLVTKRYVDSLAGTLGTVTGTGAAGRATYWTGTSTISSDANFTFDETSNTLTTDTVRALRLASGPPAAGYAPLNIGQGTAPITLVDGDMWITTSGLFARINGVSVTFATTQFPLGTNNSNIWVNNQSNSSGSTQSKFFIDGASNVTLKVGLASGNAGAPGAGFPYGAVIVGNAGVTEAASGTHSIISNLAVKALTVTGAAATVTNTATLWIEGASTATVTGGNYAIYTEHGLNRLMALQTDSTVRFNNTLTGSASMLMLLKGNDSLQYSISPSDFLSGNNITSSTFVPTSSHISNVSASTPTTAHYSRSGNQVWVYGTIDITTTAGAGTLTTIDIQLPIASDITAGADLAGMIMGTADANFASGPVFGSVSGDVARMSFLAATAASSTYRYNFMYTVQ